MHTVAQYKIVDDANIGAGFQMGLRLFDGGARKPAYDAYKLPIWVSGKGANVTVYGQVRPADTGAAQYRRHPERGVRRGAAFKTVQTVPVTSANGTFTADACPNTGGAVAAALERADVAPGGGGAQVRRALVARRVAAAALLGVAAAPARAADFEFGMEDEGLLLSNPQLAAAAVADWKPARRRRRAHPRALVGDRAAADAAKKPAGFNADDPNDPQYNWARARQRGRHRARDAGMRVMLTITGPGPLWATTRPGQAQPALEAASRRRTRPSRAPSPRATTPRSTAT